MAMNKYYVLLLPNTAPSERLAEFANVLGLARVEVIDTGYVSEAMVDAVVVFDDKETRRRSRVVQEILPRNSESRSNCRPVVWVSHRANRERVEKAGGIYVHANGLSDYGTAMFIRSVIQRDRRKRAAAARTTNSRRS